MSSRLTKAARRRAIPTCLGCGTPTLTWDLTCPICNPKHASSPSKSSPRKPGLTARQATADIKPKVAEKIKPKDKGDLTMRERVVIGDEDVEAWRARQVADGLDPEEVLTKGWAEWMAGAKGRVGKRVEEIERM